MNKKPSNKDAIIQAKAELGRRVVAFRESFGLERTAFAERMGYEYYLILSYESGKTEPNALFYKKLREEFPSVDIGFLITGRHTVLEGFEVLEDAEVNTIPVVDDIPDKGFPKGIPKSHIIDHVITTATSDPHAFGLLVQDMSFHPEAREGDFLILLPVEEAESGDPHLIHNPKKGTLELVKIHKSQDGYRVLPIGNDKKPHSRTRENIGKIYRVIEITRKFL
jgi:transcriptional regulator with XRE-family HTH domain